jgi:hypothetical protein
LLADGVGSGPQARGRRGGGGRGRWQRAAGQAAEPSHRAGKEGEGRKQRPRLERGRREEAATASGKREEGAAGGAWPSHPAGRASVSLVGAMVEDATGRRMVEERGRRRTQEGPHLDLVGGVPSPPGAPHGRRWRSWGRYGRRWRTNAGVAVPLLSSAWTLPTTSGEEREQPPKEGLFRRPVAAVAHWCFGVGPQEELWGEGAGE